MSGVGASLRLSTTPCPQLSPLPRCGRGAGGEGCPHLPPAPSSPTLGRGGGDYAPHLPPAHFRSHAVGEEGGMGRSKVDSTSVNDTVSSAHPSPAARERGRG